MKISIADVKRRLPVGTKFAAEFIGRNAVHCRPGMQFTSRQVKRQTSQYMESEFLDGPTVGETIDLIWKGKEAKQVGEAIVFTNTSVNPPEEFLKIRVIPS
jgi:hypothetical protein